MVAGFEFTEIVVVQSLSCGEVETGKIIYEYISSSCNSHGQAIPCNFIQVVGASDFRELIRSMAERARSDNYIPVLHVECHGSPVDGLSFSDGTDLSWDEVAKVLLPLNLATGFNLLAIFAACFGGYFLEQMSAMKNCPCWCVIAPTKTVLVHEVMRGFYSFYSRFFETMDAGKAVAVLEGIKLSAGCWFGYPAEVWFEKIIGNVIVSSRDNAVFSRRVKDVRRQVKKAGGSVSVGRVKRILRKQNKEILLRGYFESFFCVEALPANRERFSSVISRLKRLND